VSFEFQYCPYCAARLERRVKFGSTRPTCPKCGFVQFLDPKVAVIGMITSAGHLLMVRRAVEPGLGRWALPGGYMDAGEMPIQALRREIREEVGLEIEVDRLHDIYPMVTSERVAGGIVLAYVGTPVGDKLPALQRNDDVDEAEWFSPRNLPEDVAFASSRTLIQLWLDGSLESHVGLG
jgi:8-oxo-dGTP diphosphatase